VLFPDGVGTPETEDTGAAEDRVAEDGETDDGATEEGAADDWAADDTGAVLLGAALETAELASGMVMGTPAAAQVELTAAMVFAWSSAEHAFFTQGVTDARRLSLFLQWQAKSDSDEQPSLDNGVRKQFKAQDGMFSS